MDIAVTLLAMLNFAVPVLLLAFLILLYIRYRQHKLVLVKEDNKSIAWVDLEERRVYQSHCYRIEYPKHFAFLSIWLHDLEIHHSLSYPRSVQVEAVSYIHPDLELSNEKTSFSKLGMLVREADSIKQIIPRSAVQEALLRRRRVECVPFPLYLYLDLKGVKTIVWDISHPLNEDPHGSSPVLVESELLTSQQVWRLRVVKDSHFSRVDGFLLRQPLPELVQSFVLPVRYSPVEARLPVAPDYIALNSSCPIDCFKRDSRCNNYELSWVFSVTSSVTEVEFDYQAVAGRSSQQTSVQYNIAAIRTLLRSAFTASDLWRLCQEQPTFQAVLPLFNRNASLEEMIDTLTEYCRVKSLVPELLKTVRAVNRKQYESHRPYTLK